MLLTLALAVLVAFLTVVLAVVLALVVVFLMSFLAFSAFDAVVSNHFLISAFNFDSFLFPCVAN